MGILVNGKWVVQQVSTKETGGKFIRPTTLLRNHISKDPESKFPPVAGRYHLYVSTACPWAHRTLIMRKLKRLEEAITISVVHPISNDEGWEFSEYPGSILDTLYNSRYLYEIYQKNDPNYTGRVSVPVLWDKETQTIVNNESSEIIVMLNDAFEGPDFYPLHLRPQIDEINEYVYDKINNGVYKAGFASNQEAYEEAVTELFDALDTIEQRLSSQRYLVGNEFTLADIRLFTTLVRFDAVYVGHFKCNIKRIQDYHNLQNYLRDIYQIPEIQETVDLDHIKVHYYTSHGWINPNRIVPKGPELSLSSPHDRNRFVN